MRNLSRQSRLWLGGQLWLALLVLAVAALAWRPVHYTVRVIADYPYSLDREEAFVTDQAMTMRAGESIYRPIDELPFKVGNYPPVYPAVTALAMGFFEEPLSAGRTVALLGLLGSLAVLGGCVYTVKREPLAAVLAPLLFLTTYDVGRWMAYARVDFPAMFFAGGGLLLALWRPFRGWEYAAAGLFVLSFYTKPTQMAAFGAVALVLALGREWRPLLRLAASFTVAMLLVLAVLLITTAGEFWRHVVVYNANEMIWSDVLNYLGHLWRLLGWWILAGGVALPVAGWLWWKRGRSPRLLLISVYTLAGALTITMSAKVGSAENYLLEFEWALALLTGAVAALLLDRLKRGGGWRPAGALGAVLLLLTVHAAFIWMPMPRAILFPAPPGEAERHAADDLLLRVMQTSGPVLSEDAAYLIAAGRPVYFEPFIMSQLNREGRWDDRPMVEMLEGRYFDLVISVDKLDPDGRTPGWTDALKDATRANYSLAGEVFLGTPQGRLEMRYLYRRGAPGE